MNAPETRIYVRSSETSGLRTTTRDVELVLPQESVPPQALAALIQAAGLGVQPQAAAPAAPTACPSLAPGERYAGLVLDDDGAFLHHLILLPTRPDEDLDWETARAWAASVGGDLPSRQEQALLFANCRAHLKPVWHWSNQEHEENASYAWYCNFDGGLQYDSRKSWAGSAVAVRRVADQSFDPFAATTAAEVAP